MASGFRCLVSVTAAAAAALTAPVATFAAEGSDRRIEEIIVTAEKREATVSDTSISITAFSESMIEDFGISSAAELIDFLPATTQDDSDIRMRGIGRNSRALGGDPGIATYYNGVYYEDYGVAASENGLYDVARIEALRGPQGTLYGRNSIGGALNYITNKPTYETEAELRGIFANFDTQEYYGMLSGPIIEDRLAYRITGVLRDRGPSQDGLDGSEDVADLSDKNITAALNWKIADGWEANVRWNNREIRRKFPTDVLVTEGPITAQGMQTRGVRSVDVYALGVIPVPMGYTGPRMDFTNPAGGITQGIYARPGVDGAAVNRPNPAYRTNPDVFDSDPEDLHGYALTNDQNRNKIDTHSVQADLIWDINDTTQLKWIGGWFELEHSNIQDFDDSTSTLTTLNQWASENPESYSNEIQLLWQLGDKLELTSGLYQYHSERRQLLNLHNPTAQGRYTDPVFYGPLAALPFLSGAPVSLRSAPPGTRILGRAGGTPTGSIYATDNKVGIDAYAAYTQGVYTFNENWALTLGIRYAYDEKTAQENRYIYAENTQFLAGATPFINAQLNARCAVAYGSPCAAAGAGLTPLAGMNVLMGNASLAPTPNPNMPITPTCALDDPNCTRPLRLQAGIPVSISDASLPGKKSWDKVTYRANVDWTPNEDTLIYFGATTGYRSGGYSLGINGTQTVRFDANGVPVPGGNGVPASYDEEEVIAYEIGYKGSLLDGRLQVFSSIYYYDYEGYQDSVAEFNPETGGATNRLINAGDTHNLGMEIESRWLATDNWMIAGNYSYTTTEYDSDVFLVEDDDPATPDSLFPVQVVNLKGNDLKRIPRHKAVLYSYYNFNSSVGVFTPGGSVSYTGEYWNSGIKRDLDKVPDRVRFNIYVSFRDNEDRWNVRAFVDNVTDEGATRSLDSSSASSNWAQKADFLGSRFYGLDVTYRFSL